jgi:hypothetical protein
LEKIVLNGKKERHKKRPEGIHEAGHRGHEKIYS